MRFWRHGLYSPVVCQRRGAIFGIHRAPGLAQHDEIPGYVLITLPHEEIERCERHRDNRILAQQS